MWILPNGRTIKTPNRNRMFKIDDTQHPENNLLFWDDEVLAKHGIKRFVEIRFDEKNYRSTGYTDVEVDGTVTRTHTIEPRNALDDLKKALILRVRTEAGALIAPTNWYQVRELDEPTTKPMPSRVLNYRIAVRAVCETVEDNIKALATHAEVIAYTWADQWPDPVDPNEPVEIKELALKEISA